jgi:hypothetical protein
MFKQIPMGLAALTFFSAGGAAIKLSSFEDSEWNPDMEAVQVASQMGSRPNCTSYECRNNMSTLGYDGAMLTRAARTDK